MKEIDIPDYYLPWCRSCGNKNNWFDGCKTYFKKKDEELYHYINDSKFEERKKVLGVN